MHVVRCSFLDNTPPPLGFISAARFLQCSHHKAYSFRFLGDVTRAYGCIQVLSTYCSAGALISSCLYAATGAAPPLMFLGIDNTLAVETGPLAHCRVTLYAPYWLDNRTGLDLSFKDAPLSGRLFRVRSRFDYNEVVAQGEQACALALIAWDCAQIRAACVVEVPDSS